MRKEVRTGSILPCDICGTKVYRIPSQIRRGRFCSLKCWGAALGKKQTGTKSSETTREKIRLSKIGPNNPYYGKHAPTWGGPDSAGKRTHFQGSAEYRRFRHAVLERDNFTCQICGVKPPIPHVDHIKPYARFPELRTNIDNGRTLCPPCHRKTPSWGRGYDPVIPT